MAITTHTFNIVDLPMEGGEFNVSQTTEDATGAETIVAGVATKSHYVTSLQVRADAAMDITIGSGENADAVVTIHIGPVPLAAGFGFFAWKAPTGKGLKFTSGLAVTIDSTAAGTIWIETRGKTCADSLKL